MVGYSDVLEVKRDIARFCRSELGRRYFLWLVGDDNEVLGANQPRDPHVIKTAESVRGLTGLLVEAAEPYFWTREMCSVLEESSKNLPVGPIRVEVVPTPSGIVWFERPLRLPVNTPNVDNYGDMVGILWAQSRDVRKMGDDETDVQLSTTKFGDGLIVSFLCSSPTLNAPVPAIYLRWPYGTTRSDPVVAPASASSNPDTPLTDAKIALIGGVDAEVAARFPLSERVIREFEILDAVFALMNQTIVCREQVAPDRATRRRYEREQRKAPPVNVVYLRRKERPKGGDTPREVDWSCRWVCRSHWRWQKYPSTGDVRRILIPAAIKGPSDKPLKDPGDRVFVVKD